MFNVSMTLDEPGLAVMKKKHEEEDEGSVRVNILISPVGKHALNIEKSLRQLTMGKLLEQLLQAHCKEAWSQAQAAHGRD